MVETRLVFTAWDGEEGEEEEYLDQQLPFCCKVFSLLIYIQFLAWEHIVSPPLTRPLL